MAMPFEPYSPVWPLPYTALYSLNSLNSLPLAWDNEDKHRHPDRDRTPDSTSMQSHCYPQSNWRECLLSLLALLGL